MRAWLIFLVGLVVACQPSEGAALTAEQERAERATDKGREFDVVFADGELGAGWQYFGWAPFKATPAGAEMDLSGYGGVILKGPATDHVWDALDFEVTGFDRIEGALGVALLSGRDALPEIKVAGRYRGPVKDGRVWVRIPMSVLNPKGVFVERVRFRGMKSLDKAQIVIDKVRLRVAGAGAADTREKREANAKVKCGEPTSPISPDIYGVNYTSPKRDGSESQVWSLGTTSRRWGGNPTSRFNPAKNVWNTAEDWFYMNARVGPGWTWKQMLDENRKYEVSTALTVPLIGWVARDDTAVGFPVSRFGPQRRTAPGRKDAGDGFRPDGTEIEPGPPTTTSVAFGHAKIGEWMRDIRAAGHAPEWVLLGNEPMIWHATHRDVHPRPAGYDEVFEKTVAAAREVRAVFPKTLIAGPGVWGWPAYSFSGQDQVAGFFNKPDRRRHGDVPFLRWWLGEMKRVGDQENVRLLDALDVHFYPQLDGVYSPRADRGTVERRLRSTRALWDRAYVDESWIAQSVHLLPRMRAIIDEVDPSLKLVIGEYNFGADAHISGAVAQAEALGRFAEAGVHAAWYWGLPPQGSHVAAAFAAYRNYDGAGGRFLDELVRSKSEDELSVFASTTKDRSKIVAVVINRDPREPLRARVRLQGCKATKPIRAFALAGPRAGLQSAATPGRTGDDILIDLEPMSVQVIELGAR